MHRVYSMRYKIVKHLRPGWYIRPFTCHHPCHPLVFILIKSVSPPLFRHISLWEGLIGPEKDQDVFVPYSTGRDGRSAGGAHLSAAVFGVFFHLHLDFGFCPGSGLGSCFLLGLHGGFFLHFAVKASPFTYTDPQHLFCVRSLQPIFEAELLATGCLGLPFNGIVKHSLQSNFFQDAYQCRWYGFSVD